jgi:hypothetical protein
MDNWIKLTDRLPDPGKQVWVLRRWVPMNPEFGTEPRTEVRIGMRVDQPLVTEGDVSENCHWYSDGSNYSDLTVAGWQDVPPLADVICAVNSYDQLVADNANLHQDLSDARTGWEQATEAVREAEVLRKQLMEALHNLEVSANSLQYCFDQRPENFGTALTQLAADAERARTALAAAEAA